MRPWEFHYRWEWDLHSSPEALWPFISDTNRFNRDTGVPAVERRLADGERLTNARRRLRLFRLGVPVEWEEEPFEWVRPYRFGVVRRYTRGPVAEMHTLAEMTPRPGGGTHLVYQVWARPSNLLGWIAIPAQIGVLSAQTFSAAFRRYDRLAVQSKPAQEKPVVLELAGPVTFAPGGRERLQALREKLLAQDADRNLVVHLMDLIEQADDLTVSRLRPYALADYWNTPRRDVLELCLWATRLGLLNLQWDVLCPLCRGAKQSADSLGSLQPQIHCDSCNIDFTANFDRSVELTFRPNPAVRPGLLGEFCVGGPQLTPHIVAQQLLPPSVQRELTVPLEAGRYRLRTLELGGGQFLSAGAGGAPQMTLRASEAGWPSAEARLSLMPALRLDNATNAEQLFVLERMAWSDQAVTAAEVTSLQVFRDLFADEALRPGDRISVGSLTILFTDLRDSTRLYRESGDAVAFGRVMSHFDVLREAIMAEDGALVKTIGDAVMAVFRRPVGALHAFFRAQESLAALTTGGEPPLQLKAGIHTGPCVAVTLNGRLDYFGSTVNIASRLEGLSASHPGAIISAAVRADPEVAAWLAEGMTAEPFAATLKGFEDESFELYAVKPDPASAPVQPRVEKLVSRLRQFS
jgi:class 3 adenylate cyclase